MDRDNNTQRKQNPRDTTNFLSLVTFLYTIKLFWKGCIKGLELDDIYEVSPSSNSKLIGDQLEHQWQKEQAKKSPSILRALWILHYKTIILIGLVQFLTMLIMTYWSPETLSKLISYFTATHNSLTKQDAIFYASLLISINFLNSLVRHNFRLVMSLLGIKIKVSVASVLYRKALKLNLKATSLLTAGKFVTIITKDVDSWEMLALAVNNSWISLIQTVFICYLIYQRIGLASSSGILFFLGVLPFQIFIARKTYNYKLKCSKKTDERLNLIRQVLIASKLIKLYTWENFFERKIFDARKTELKQLHKLFFANVWIQIIGNICSKTAFLLFLTTYVWMDNNISAELVFYIMNCCSNLEETLNNQISQNFACLVQMFAVAERVENVLNAEESYHKQKLKECRNPKIYFENVDITITNINILENISLTLSKGLNVVIGQTGSGKSVFLKTILEECQTTGNIIIEGRVSYASQEPWLFPSTIKNNILFGEDFDKTRYEKILEVCNLKHDLNLLTGGDDTFIGESGLNLSKGQQARINLARAVYTQSDIYLLDDCLASLDANVSNSIFKDCILEFLHDKIRIFVTNNQDFEQKADKIILVDSKSVKIKNNSNRSKVNFQKDSRKDEDLSYGIDESGYKNVYHEEKRSGRVPLTNYSSYIRYGGGWLIFSFVISLFIATQFLVNSSDKMLSSLIDIEENTTKNSSTKDQILIYSAISSGSIILTIAQSFLFFYFVRTASNNIHQSMVRSLINATMSFFDSHYLGNVINRFTKDYVTLDETLPYIAKDCLFTILTVIGGIVLVTTISYIFLLKSLIFLAAIFALKQFCQPTGRNLERLHIIARSPINGHLNSTLEGLITIRTSNAEEIVKREFDKHQNLFISALSMVVTTYCSLSFFLKCFGTLFVAVIIIQFLNTDLVDNSAGDVGLVITQSFIISSNFASAILNIADCENLMVSVERILEYTKLEQEEKNGKYLIGWPESGTIQFQNVSLNYNKKKTLHDVNFVLKHKQKLGIIGRTGAGKSSIISCLLRLYQPTGKILIDGVNTKNLSLFLLRSKISVMCQDPYLFSGTIRENLDPLKQHKDGEIWKVLKDLQLDLLITNLDIEVNKYATFSAGQKQLICLARVLIQKNKILVLDEATAHVDQNSEILINETINKYCSECTVVIIAHRISMVQNCDKVIVLKDGKICKFGTPDEVIYNFELDK